jgi:hypothetical protein
MPGGEDLITRLLADLHDRVRPRNEAPKGPLAKFTSPMDRITVEDQGLTTTVGTPPYAWSGVLAVLDSQADWQAGTVPWEASVSKIPGALTLRPRLGFDGIDDYCTVAVPAQATGAMTWEVRLKPAQVAKDQMFMAGPSLPYFRINSSRPFISIQTGAGQKSLNSATILANGVEYWLQATYDGTTLKAYVNGVLDGSLVISSPMGAWQVTRLGRWTDADPRGFVGDILEARAWNRALTPAELGQPVTGSENGLVACWRFQEGSGLTATDAGPNGYLATLSGGPTWTEPATAVYVTQELDLGAVPARPAMLFPVMSTASPAAGSATVTRYRTRALQTDAWGPWTNAVQLPSGGALTAGQPQRYLQAEIQLATTDTTVTPILDQFRVILNAINWSEGVWA